MKKEKKFNILVYTCGLLSLADQVLEKNNVILNFKTPDNCPDFNNFDFAFILDGILEKDEILRREKEISRAIYQGKTGICFLYRQIPSPGKPIPVFRSNPMTEMAIHLRNTTIKNIRETSLVGRFVLNLNVLSMDFNEERTQFQIKRSEFKNFFDKYSVTKSYFKFQSNFKSYTKVALVNDEIVSFAYENKFFLLPLHMPGRREDKISMFHLLANSILAYCAKVYFEEPAWLHEIVFHKEEDLLLKVNRLKRSIKKIEKEIYKYYRYKGILYLGDNKLTDEVINFFEKGLGLSCFRKEKYEEDFWLIKGKDKIALVEVKGLNGDVGRRHINQVDSHRDAYELDDLFPAILIVNTHMKGIKTLSDKNKPISSDIIKHAVRNKILILRTLDLIRILGLIESKKKNLSELVSTVKTEYGWLKADSETWTILKR